MDNLALLASKRRQGWAGGRQRQDQGRRERRTSNFLELPVADYDKKRRICSLPEQGYNPRMSEEFYRLRSFSICKGRLVKHGDSIASRRSRSPASPNTSSSFVFDSVSTTENEIVNINTVLYEDCETESVDSSHTINNNIR